ncbi:PAAR domain-containing protein [candidate division KSB1 bacterium]|nr:PAAR domain-containing protein [candidate division KSB1 bacterium]
MPLAARVTDPTSHGTPLSPGPGSANVLIGGLPAWRATSDFHVCPLINPSLTPHVGGVVSVGSTTVLINNLPAARQGDMITESAPPNSIVAGAPTVQIGG